MAYPIMITGGNDIAQTALQLLYQNESSYFNGDVTSSELQLEVVYQTVGTPTVELNPAKTPTEFLEKLETANPTLLEQAKAANATNLEATPPNIALTIAQMKLDFYDYTNNQRGALQLSVTKSIEIWGVLGLNGQNIALSGLSTAVLDGPVSDKALIQEMMKKEALPDLQKKIESIQLPQFQKILDSSVNASVVNFNIANKQFEIDATASNTTSVGAAPPNSTPLPGAITGLIEGSVANAIMKSKIPAVHKNFSETKGGSFGAAGIKGSMTFSNPTLVISNGQARASGRLSVSAAGGIKAFWTWAWVPLPIPDTDVVINLELDTANNNKAAEIKITGIQNIHVNLGDWPTVLKPVEDVIEGLLDGIVSIFQGMISSAVSGITVPLFTLPNTIPGTSVSADLSFAPNGLSFSGDFAKAVIQIST